MRVAIEAFGELSETKRRLYRLTVLAALPEREFEVRGIAVDDDIAAHIRSGGELRELERWARRAREVAAAAQLFST